MSVLAFKALGYGAEQIPDKFFEKIPGGFFTPQENKDIEKGRKERKDGYKDKERHKSEERSDKRRSRRDSPSKSDTSDHSAGDDTDYEQERERRKQERRRAKGAGRSSSRSQSRSRDNRRSRDLDGESSETRNMAQAEQGAPYFPPPPTAEYQPYNPQEYTSRPAQDGRTSSPVMPSYGYSPQVNIFPPFRRTTLPMTPEHPTPVNSCPPMLMNRTPSVAAVPFPYHPPLFHTLSRGTPVSATFTPSYEPPLAALLHRPCTNTPKSAAAQSYTPQPPSGQREVPRSATSRYTPGPEYAPSPSVNAQAPTPPVGAPYAPYNPADYPTSNAYASPPPFARQRSNSQPAFVPGNDVPYHTYTPPSAGQQQMTAYDQAPSRRGSTKPRREHRHRARSADSHSHSSKNHRRNSPRMTKVRERLDGMDLRERGLAATVGGALAGGLAGRQLGKSRLTSLVGAAAGALGGRAIIEQRSK